LPQEPPAPRAAPNAAELELIWSRVVLDAGVKARVLDCVRRFNSGDAPAPRGLLIYGPPGTGKTEMIRRIAESVSGTFMWLGAADLRAGYIGQTAFKTREIWRKARGYGRCAISIDWCEGIFAGAVGGHGDCVTMELVSEFLQQWDESAAHDGGVWVIGETFRPEPMHAAILSRFDTLVETRLPTAAERLKILTLMMQEAGLTPVIPGFVEAATAGMSGRELERWVYWVHLVQSEDGSLGMAPSDEATWRDALERQRR
jgi:transitional endoplasmic reticulum ATPase